MTLARFMAFAPQGVNGYDLASSLKGPKPIETEGKRCPYNEGRSRDRGRWAINYLKAPYNE
jgi:hypothetical protein